MRPQEVLDHQADLLARLTNPLVRAAWRNQLEQDHVRHPGMNKVPEQIRANAAAMVASMTHNVRDAHAYHVNQDMSLMVEYAASQLDQLDRIDRSIAPTRNGMVRFERPLPFPDVRGRRMGVSWLVWGPVVVRTAARHDKGEPEEQMAIWMFNDHWTNPDEIADLLMKDPSLRPVLEAPGAGHHHSTSTDRDAPGRGRVAG